MIVANAVNVSSGPFAYVTDQAIPKPVSSWWLERNLSGGGALLDLGCHMINLLRWYFGDDVTITRAVLQHRFHLDVEDFAIVFLSFRNGPVATIESGWFSLSSDLEIELFGTAGIERARGREISTAMRVMNILKKKPPSWNRVFFDELVYFTDCVRKDIAPSPSCEDGLKDLEVISLAYKNQEVL